MIEVVFIIISLLLVLACGLFVTAEFALVTVSRARVEKLAKKGDKGAQGVLTGLQSLSTQLSGAQIGITITNLAIGFLAQPSVAELLRGPLGELGISGSVLTTLSVAIAIAVATIVTMLFGELVPKNLAIAKPLESAKAVQNSQRLFTKTMHYPILFMNGIANKIIRSFNIEPQEELASARSVDELLSVVKHSARRGTLEKDTAVLLERSLEFSERRASDVMTPRVKLEIVNAGDKVPAVIEAVKRSGFSRFPVIDGDVDDLMGLVHVREAVAVPYEKRADTDIKSIMKPAVFIPSSIELDILTEKMREEGLESVITIDEFGGVDGIVTLEDLIEELVGEVKDEHDDEGIAIKKTGARSWLVSGLLRPDEISQETGLILPEDEEFETVGGLLLDRLEELPRVGDEARVKAIDHDGAAQTVKLRVSRMDERRIDRLEIIVDKEASK